MKKNTDDRYTKNNEILNTRKSVLKLCKLHNAKNKYQPDVIQHKK